MASNSEMSLSSVSVVTPTFREAANLPEFIERIERVRLDHSLNLELLIVDDNSADGTEELIAGMNRDWVRLIVRRQERGLSSAVIRGLKEAKNDVLVVMDADLSHPPEMVPELLNRIAAGAEFVIGSRYVAGGTTDAEWGLFRKLNSKVATLMARPFTSACDPMAGFFALSRKRFQSADQLNPIGYKIGLELIVKCGSRRVEEVPIHFADRVRGESKLNLREQIRYVQHLGRLLTYRFYRLLHLKALIITLAAFLIPTSLFLTQQSYFVDETTQLSGLTLSPMEVTRWLAGDEPHRFGVPPDRSPPVSYWLGWSWSKLFGLSEGSMRWFGVLCAGIAVIIIFEAARRVWGLGPACASGLLAGLSPNTVMFAVEIRPYPVFLMFAAGAMCCLTGLFAHASRAEWKWLLGLASCCIAAMYTHYFGVLLAGAVFAAALIISIINRHRLYPVLMTGAAVALAGIGLWPFVTAAVGKSGADESSPIDVTELARFAYRGLFGHPVMTTSVIAMVAATLSLAVLLTLSLWPKKRATAASYAILLAVAIGMITAVIAGLIIDRFQSLHPSYNIWRLPAIALLCGSAVAVKPHRLRAVSWVGVLVLITCSGFGAVQLMRHGHVYASGPHRELDAIITQLGPENVTVIHEPGSDWGKMYFPLTFTFGDLPQYLAEPSDTSSLRRLLDLNSDRTIQEIATRYIVVVSAREQSHIDLARYVSGEFLIPDRGPVAQWILLNPTSWRAHERHWIVTMVAADVDIFQRAE
jgi:glycosyltransferase involved in cell wall biosynthesis